MVCLLRVCYVIFGQGFVSKNRFSSMRLPGCPGRGLNSKRAGISSIVITPNPGGMGGASTRERERKRGRKRTRARSWSRSRRSSGGAWRTGRASASRCSAAVFGSCQVAAGAAMAPECRARATTSALTTELTTGLGTSISTGSQAGTRPSSPRSAEWRRKATRRAVIPRAAAHLRSLSSATTLNGFGPIPTRPSARTRRCTRRVATAQRSAVRSAGAITAESLRKPLLLLEPPLSAGTTVH